MATATKSKHSRNDTTEQFGQFNEQFTKASKQAGTAYLDGYDKFVEGVISVQHKVAEQSQNDALKSVIETQVDMTRQLASAYTSAVRDLIA